MKNRDIYLMYQSKEFVVSRYTLKTIDEVANFLGTAPYFVERVLEGKTIKKVIVIKGKIVNIVAI